MIVEMRNANKDFIAALKNMAKACNVELKFKDKTKEKKPSKRLEKALQEAKEIKENPQKYKSFKNMDEIKAYLES